MVSARNIRYPQALCFAGCPSICLSFCCEHCVASMPRGTFFKFWTNVSRMNWLDLSGQKSKVTVTTQNTFLTATQLIDNYNNILHKLHKCIKWWGDDISYARSQFNFTVTLWLFWPLFSTMAQKVSVYFSCLGECCLAALLSSSRNVLCTTKIHLTFYCHEGDNDRICVSGWTYPVTILLRSCKNTISDFCRQRVAQSKQQSRHWLHFWVNFSFKYQHESFMFFGMTLTRLDICLPKV